MVLARKYLFDDLDFDLEEQRRLEELEAAKRPEEPPPPTFSEEELAAARAVAFAQGRAAGLADAVEDQTAVVLRTVQALQGEIALLMQSEQQRSLAFTEAALELSMAMLKQMFPHAASAHGLNEITAVIGTAMRERIDDPRLVIRVADSVLDQVQAEIDRLAADAGYAGKLVLLAEPNFAASDVRVEWANGGTERDSAAILAHIEHAVSQAGALNAQAQEHAGTPPQGAAEDRPTETVNR